MYSLVWQSVMWRPGKLWFLIGVKNPLPIRPAATARKQGPLRGRAGRQIRDFSRATPPFVAHPATLSHPDRRAFLIPSVAQQPGVRVEVWFQDEARIGQKNTLTRVWGQTGSRPVAPKDLGFASAYLFG